MDRKFMLKAIELAKKAESIGEIPVGAVIVKNGEILAEGFNTRETGQNALGHAEISVIDKACKKTGSWRLDDCELYVTLEPCPMCAGAIINARIPTVVFGSYDTKCGCLDSALNFANLGFGSSPEIYGGICEKQCNELLDNFFKKLRKDGNK